MGESAAGDYQLQLMEISCCHTSAVVRLLRQTSLELSGQLVPALAIQALNIMHTIWVTYVAWGYIS
jgi:hypothetical protein